MTVIGFPAPPAESTKRLDEIDWNSELGKPHIDINAPLDSSYKPEPPINDLARYRDDRINPDHYKHHGIECIEMTRHMGFREGNIVKYVYRYQAKGRKEDLQKAKWYLEDLLNNDTGC